MGIKAEKDLLGECLGLVKFFDANDLGVKTQIGTEKVERTVMVEKEKEEEVMSISGGVGLGAMSGDADEGEEEEEEAAGSGGNYLEELNKPKKKGRKSKKQKEEEEEAKLAAEKPSEPAPEMVESTVVEEVPVYSYEYPVTAMKIGGCDEKQAETLFRQFVVGGFSERGPKAKDYEDNSEKFGSILGFDKKKMASITKSIGGAIYENYITQAMTDKNELDNQDMMMLAQIQSKLRMPEETSEKLLLEVSEREHGFQSSASESRAQR